MSSLITCTSVNSMATAFRSSQDIRQLGEQANRQLRRKKIGDKATVKWHRLGAIAQRIERSK